MGHQFSASRLSQLIIVIVPLVVGGSVAWLLFSRIFDGCHDFFECCRKAGRARSYWLWWKRPDEWAEAATADAKLLLYFILSFGSACLTYYSLHRILGQE